MGILSARFLVSELLRLNQGVIVVGEGDGVMEDVEEYLDNLIILIFLLFILTIF